MKPRRIQLSRRKGWRLPEGAVIVSRPSRWGNPWRLRDRKFEHADGTPAPFNEEASRELCVRDFEAALIEALMILPFTVADVRRELRGKTLACWCPIGAVCHADVLLRIAAEPDNEGPTP